MKTTEYMTMKELTKLHRKITKKWGKKLWDSSLPFEEKKLPKPAAARYKNTAMWQQELNSVRNFLWEYVYRIIMSVNDIEAYKGTINILGRNVLTIFDFCDSANQLFKMLNTDFYIWNDGVNFIFGILEAHNEYFLMREEFVTSPETIPFAAGVYKNTAIIRKVVIEKIFYNRFQRYFYKTGVDRVLTSQNTCLLIQEKLVKSVLYYAGIENIEELLFKKRTLIEDLMDNEYWRIFGRLILRNDIIFSETDNINNALLEAIASWSPNGFFSQLIDRIDLKQAARKFYIFLFNNWYFQGSELSALSKVVIGLAFKFILDDGSVDFASIEDKRQEVYAFLKQCYTNLADPQGAVELELLRMVTNGNEAKYHHSLQEYIIERSKECIIEKPSNDK